MKQDNLEVIHGGDVERLYREYGFSPADVLDYSSNTNPLPLPEGIQKYIKDHLDLLTRYPDREYYRLRSALSQYTGYAEEWIMAGNGATELIYLAARALSPQKVLIPAPSFADFARAFAIQAGKVDYFPLEERKGFKLDVPGFIGAMSKGYEAVVLCNPNNPTGCLLSKKELLEIVSQAARQQITVILDETFIEFVEDPAEFSMLSELGKYRNLLILRAFTKFFGVPGLRLGYCLASPVLLQKLRVFQEPWTVNTLASYLGPWFLEQKEFIEKTREWIKAERPFFLDSLREIPQIHVYEGHANFVLCRLKTKGWNVKGLQKAFEGIGIMIRDASSFPYLNEKYFRLAIKDRPGNLRVVKELEELLSFYAIEEESNFQGA